MAAYRKHARLSASGAKRWINCPRSVALEEQFPDTTSEYAEEGTKAHAIAEILLKKNLGLINARSADEALKRHDPYPTEMLDYAKIYVDNCMESYQSESLGHKDAIAMIEAKVSFSQWVQSGFGTCDFLVLAGNRLIIRDLKYGKGVPVNAEDNPQPRLYALGAFQEYGWIYPIEEIEMCIDQPRLGSYTTEILTTKELLAWATEIKKQAKLAHNDEGEFQPGEWCQFCKARAVCRTRASAMLAVVQSIIKK